MSKKKSTNNGIVYSTDPSFKPIEENEQTEETLAPAKQPLRIRFETKHRGGKAVTVISGFLGKEDDLEKLGKQLKTFCGTGGSVKDGEILVQGDHRVKVSEWLKKNGYKGVKGG